MTIELYNQKEVLRSYVESERYEAAEEAENATKIEIAREMIQGNEPIDKIKSCLHIDMSFAIPAFMQSLHDAFAAH